MPISIEQLRTEAAKSGYMNPEYIHQGEPPAGAIQFRGKVYYEPYGIHSSALRLLLKDYDSDTLDRELTEKNFGFVIMAGPRKGQFVSAKEQESDLANIFDRKNTHKPHGTTMSDLRKDYLKRRAGKPLY